MTEQEIIEGESQELVPTVTPMTLLDRAVASGADVETLKALMDLQDRYDAKEAFKAFTEALVAFKAAPPTLVKDTQVSFQNKKGGKTDYKHATLDQVSTVIGEALSKHGLSHRWVPESLEQGAVRVTCVLMHRLGHSESVSMQSGRDESGGKNSIQGLGSTVTYLERYTLLAATGMAVGEDTDGEIPPGFIDDTQVATLNEQLDEVGADKEKFCAFMKVTSLIEIQTCDYGKALERIDAKKRKMEADNENAS